MKLVIDNLVVRLIVKINSLEVNADYKNYFNDSTYIQNLVAAVLETFALIKQ